MKRNKLSILLFSLILCSSLSAQDPIYLFNDFQDGRVTMKPRTDVTVKLNIDAGAQRIFYWNGDDLMELMNINMLDTLFVSGRKFVWKDSCLCEMVSLEGGDVYINWKLRESFVGKEGAMGITTQGKAETYYVPGLNSKSSLESRARYRDETEVFRLTNENRYWFTIQGSEYKVRRPKEIYKAFPQWEAPLKTFVRENNIVMTNAEEALKLIGYLFTLSKQQL